MNSLQNRVDALSVMHEHVEDAWSTWVSLTDALVDDDTVSAYLPYADFLGAVVRALLAATFVGLYQLYDGRSDVLSIPRVIKEVATSSAATSSPPAGLARELDEALALVKKIQIPRHKLFAHRDYSQTWGDVFLSSGVRPLDLSALLKLTDRILGELRSWSLSTYNRPSVPSPAAVQAAQFVELLKARRTDRGDVG